MCLKWDVKQVSMRKCEEGALGNHLFPRGCRCSPSAEGPHPWAIGESEVYGHAACSRMYMCVMDACVYTHMCTRGQDAPFQLTTSSAPTDAPAKTGVRSPECPCSDTQSHPLCFLHGFHDQK